VAPLAGAVALLTLLTFATVKVIVPQFTGLRSSLAAPVTPVAMETRVPPPPVRAATPQADAPTGAQEVRPFVSSAGRFSVLFPGTPEQNTQRIALSDTDSVILYQFQFGDANLSYAVLYNDYPAQYVTAEPQPFLEHLRDATMAPAKATLTTDQAIDFNSVPGRVFKFTDPAGNIYTVADLLRASGSTR